MSKTLKKTLSLILTILMIVSAVPAVIAAENDIASGTAGDSFTWVIDADGTLTISGEGDMAVEWADSPWYSYNDSILNIVIEEGITDIPGYAFWNASNCISVTVPSTVTTINSLAFEGMTALKEIKLDENNADFKTVDGVLFSKDGKTLVLFPCDLGLTEYTIPDTVETLVNYAFISNACLKKVTVPDSVTSIGESVFKEAYIESVILGNGITKIPYCCFSYSSIRTMVIPDSVKTLGYAIFWSCKDLETLVIDSGMESIASNVLGYTNSLSAVHYNGTQEEWDAIEIDAENTSYNGLLTKKIHFVEQKDGVASTCKKGHTAGLYCSDCECYVTGEEINAISEHTPGTAVDENIVAAKCETAGSKDVVVYCSVCNDEISRQTVETEPKKGHSFGADGTCSACGAPCDHASAVYTQTADTHQLKCSDCGKTEVVAHNIVCYYDIGEGKCAPYCYDCGYIDVLAKDHLITKYYWYDDEYCIICCANCGYGDEETGLVKHSFKYTDFPATETEVAYTKHTCEKCDYYTKEYDTDNAIVFKLYSEDNEWENSAILVYANGEPVTLVRNMTGDEYDTFVMPYDKNSSYVFKWINAGYDECFGVEIYLPGSEESVYEKYDMSGYEMLQTIFSVNVADYSDVDAALAKIPDYFEYYSAESVANLVTAVKGVKRMLSAGKQTEVDAMAAAIEKAVKSLVELDEPVPNGVINMSAGNYVYINDSDYSDDLGYAYYNEETGDETFYKYDGKYVILETESKDKGEEDYVHYGFYTYTGEIEIDLVNTFITGYSGNFGIYNDADVTLTLFGANVLACYYTDDDDTSGIEIEEDAKLHIKNSSGSLVAISENNCAGIGSEEENNGEIIIDGGTIFALSTGDGAGIGGGYEGGAGKITINGGKIWAECMSDDGSGIGVGDDGTGGDIIINGGNIIALSLDDDGAGIGGADSGYVDSITINGGNIVVGAEDGAAIGGGQESESYGGKIIINGGSISASRWHNVDENLIGNGSSESDGETEYNFVQINGGYIDANGANDISPEPKDKDGNAVVKTTVKIDESLIGEEITLKLSNGTEYTVTVYDTEIEIYLSEKVTVANANILLNCAAGKHSFTNYVSNNDATCTADGTKTALCGYGCGKTDKVTDTGSKKAHIDANGDSKCDIGGEAMENTATSDNCDHLCHSNNWFIKNIIWKIVSFFWKLFRMNPTCTCGAAHY